MDEEITEEGSVNEIGYDDMVDAVVIVENPEKAAREKRRTK